MQIFTLPKAAPVASSRTYSSCKAYFYTSGTTTAATVYQDAALTIPHAQPVVASSAGVLPVIYLDDSVAYRVRLVTSNDVLIYDVDPISSAGVTIRYEAETGETGIVDYSYPPGHCSRYGADPAASSSTNTTAINTAAAYCLASGTPITGAAGTYSINGTVTLRCAGDLSMMTLSCPSSSVSPAVRVGTITGATCQLQGSLSLPKVVNSTKPGTGWASQQVGIELANLYESHITVNYVYGFAVGVDCGGYTSGFSYNTVQLLMVSTNKVGLRVQGKHVSTGWANENTFIGGRFFIPSGEGSAISGARFIQLTPLATTGTGVDWPNGNKFIGCAVEGEQPEYQVEVAGQYNQFIGLRYEVTAPAVPQILLTGHATDTETAYNQFIGGYRLATAEFTRVGISYYNQIVDPSKNSFGGSSSVLNIKNEGDGDNPVIQGFSASVTDEYLNAGTSATQWGFRLASTGLQGKEKDDSAARVDIEFDTGKAKFYNTTLTAAAPTVGANQVGLGATTQTTVGSAGAATALPAQPTGYLIINVAGTERVVPFYAKS